jgi:hypothetical protein
MRDITNNHKILIGKHEKRNYLEDRSMNGSKILKCILKTGQRIVDWTQCLNGRLV